jgi:hypothetical protein
MPEAPARADAKLAKDARASLGDGVVYVPPAFSSEDGSFDLIVHFHGNTDLVMQSVTEVGINAVVYIINYGESSRVYARPFSNPDAFDALLVTVEQRVARMGLNNPRIKRVALASWSAGYGALYHILRSRSRRDRVDALLMMDSLHASYQAGDSGPVQEASIAPFVSVAKRAILGDQLMVITHSNIDVHGYLTTTASADALLQMLEMKREAVDSAQASPPQSKLDIAIKAFPSAERNWMKVTSALHVGQLHVLGATGNGKGDHIAHLAQMAATVLPPLKARWEAQP